MSNKQICPACKAERAISAIYCSVCGADMNPGSRAFFCTLCGQPLDDDANFCAYCRTSVPYKADNNISKPLELPVKMPDMQIISFIIK